MNRSSSALIVLLIPVACSLLVFADDAAPAAKLTETPKWQLRQLTAGGVERKLQGTRATLSFANGKLRGSTGCNLLSGTYSAKADGTLVFPEVAVTERGCEHFTLEQKFLEAFGRIRTFELKKGVLVLSDGTAANRLEFVPFEARHLPLAGTTWSLTHFTESDEITDSATTVLPGRAITLVVNDAKVSGSAGCNRYFGGITFQKAGQLKFGALGSTKRACPGNGVMQQESRFLTTMPKMTKFTINENVLKLSNEAGTLGLQFAGEKAN